MLNLNWWNNLLVAFAEAGGAAGAATGEVTDAAAQTGSVMSTVIMFVVMGLLIYFMMFRPQRKKDKKVKDMLSALKVGDRICTIGGIYGTVAGLKDDIVTILVGANKMQMVIARWAVRSIEDAPVENDSEPQV